MSLMPQDIAYLHGRSQGNIITMRVDAMHKYCMGLLSRGIIPGKKSKILRIKTNMIG